MRSRDPHLARIFAALEDKPCPFCGDVVELKLYELHTRGCNAPSVELPLRAPTGRQYPPHWTEARDAS